MPAPIDLTGHTYGRLTVLYEPVPAVYPRKWLCICICGHIKEIIGGSLRSGATQSCGCLNREIVQLRGITHGKWGTRLYAIWHGMKQRCENSNSTSFVYYGGKGVTVCVEWESFSGFYAWSITSGYTKELTIDRIDGNGGYCPDNCRWTSATIQARNQKRRTTNTSGYVGVSFVPRLNKWHAYLTVKYKKVNLGHYAELQDAVNARDTYISTNNLIGFPTK